MKERLDLSKDGIGTLGYTHTKIKLALYLTSDTINQFQQTEDLKYEKQNSKTLKRQIEGTTFTPMKKDSLNNTDSNHKD